MPVVLLLSLVAAAAAATPARISHLRTEYLEEPLGVDVAAPRFSWDLALADPDDPASRGRAQAYYQVRVFASDNSVAWDSGKVASKRTHLIVYAGNALNSESRYHWNVQSWLDDGTAVAAAPAASFLTGLLDQAMWTPSEWITGGNAAPLLRKEFHTSGSNRTSGAASRATLYVAGIGYNEVYLNGKKLGDAKLGSGWTDQAGGKRVAYSTFDVTSLLAPAGSANALGVALGNGWFSCGEASAPTTQPGCVDSPPQLRLQLFVEGLVALSTNASWKVSAGPISYNSLYNGEHYDARVAEKLEGWTSAGFDDRAWAAAAAASSVANKAKLSSALFEPTRHLARLPVRAVTSPAPGVQVFDFGQNMAGVVSLTGLRCERGSNVTIRHAELLTHPPYGPRDGSIYVGNLRKAQATDIYTCRGDDEGEDYVPTFTQHGFRYAEVSGYTGGLLEDDQVSNVFTRVFAKRPPLRIPPATTHS